MVAGSSLDGLLVSEVTAYGQVSSLSRPSAYTSIMSELLTGVVTLVVGAAIPLTYLLFGSQRRLRQLERLAAIHSSLPDEGKESLEGAISKLAIRVGNDAELAEKQSDWLDFGIACLLEAVLIGASIVALCTADDATRPLAIVLLVLSIAILVVLVIYGAMNRKAMSGK